MTEGRIGKSGNQGNRVQVSRITGNQDAGDRERMTEDRRQKPALSEACGERNRTVEGTEDGRRKAAGRIGKPGKQGNWVQQTRITGNQEKGCRILEDQEISRRGNQQGTGFVGR